MPTFLILGAGPTGIGAAVRLTELGVDYAMVEAEADAGGLAGSVTDSCGYTWDLGGHVIHSHFAEFDDAVQASGVPINGVIRNGWVWLGSGGPQTLVPTPIQQQLTELPSDLAPDAPVAHLADYYRNHFGRGLYEQFFEPFNLKMWTVPLHQIDADWTALRSGSGARNVPLLALAGTVATPVETFPYPAGGTGALWRAVHSRLTTPGSARFGTRVTSLDLQRRVATLDDGTTLEYQYCVSSAPLPVMTRWAGVAPAALRASRLHAVGLGFRGDPPPTLADKTWLYCPDPDVCWYRATMLSNYDPGNAGAGRWNIMCEVPIHGPSPLSADDAVTGVIESLRQLGADDHRLESRFVRTLSLGYPVPTLGRDEVLREIDAYLVRHGIYSRGRFGGWRYESSNQDYTYMQGRQAVDAALFDAPEDVYWHPERF